MTNRLPVVGSDDNTWGTVLNDYLAVAHNPDGTAFTVTSVSDASSGGTDVYVIYDESPPNINEVLLCDCSGLSDGNTYFVVGLPDATDPDWNTNTYTIKKIDTSSNFLVILTYGGDQQIDGSNDYIVIAAPYASATLVSDGTAWNVV